MAGIDEIRKNRLKKLKTIKNRGILPYPSKTKRTHTCKEAIKGFSKLSKSKKEIVLAGRLMSQRQHGGLTFCDIWDGTEKIQILFKKDRIGERGYRFFLENFDIGDFIEARGTLFKTKKKEKTLQVSDFKILAKSLLPLPEKWHGLKDVEERYRKRYLDLIFNKEVREKFKIRSRIIKEIREFERDFFEETSLECRFCDEAIDILLTHAIKEDLDIISICQRFAKDLELGLKLVKDRTGQDIFEITREALLSPEDYIRGLIKSAYKGV